MACKGNRTGNLIEYAKSLGITINIGKNNAQGNRGFFKAKDSAYRIDISKSVSEKDIDRVLLHELIHYMHFTYDKTLKTPYFIFNNNYQDYESDLLKLTVDDIPKDFAKSIYENKNKIKNEIENLSKKVKAFFPDIKLSDKNNKIEKVISKSEFKYLLKHDNVKLISGFSTKIYSIDNLTENDISIEHLEYLRLSSLKRRLNSINNKISRLNKYYNAPSELLARSFEYYVFEPNTMKQKTPNLYLYYNHLLEHKNIKILNEIIEIIKQH